MVKNPPSNSGAEGSTLGWRVKILHALQPKKQNLKQKQYCDKFNKDFKNGPHQKIYLKILNFFPPSGTGNVMFYLEMSYFSLFRLIDPIYLGSTGLPWWLSSKEPS